MLTEQRAEAISYEDFRAALAQLQTGYDAFTHILAQVPVARQTLGGACGDWSPQQVVQHISGWLMEARRRFERYPRGTAAVTYDVDALNAVFIWERKAQSWEQTLAELAHRQQALVAVAEDTAAYQVEREGRYLWWLRSMAQEYRNHGTEIVAFSDEA